MPSLRHLHSENDDSTHTHEHRHGTLVHSHPHTHVVGIDHDDPAAHEHEHTGAHEHGYHHDHHHDGGQLHHDHPHGDHGHDHGHSHPHGHGHDHGDGHGHSHGLVDRSILRSRDGVRTVAISLGVLCVTAAIQAVIFVASGSVALLADMIHNTGDALTAVPLGIAFWLRSYRGEKLAGLFVVLAIFVSACVALYETIQRLIHPQPLSHLGVLAVAGVIGFLGNELAARVRLRGGQRLRSPALIADGNHARVDGYVSLSVIASAALVWLGWNTADPLIGLAITVVILKITWDSWHVIHATEPGEKPAED
jgi:Co/Zn/Cd efflux system component